jgi:hypothetical protein
VALPIAMILAPRPNITLMTLGGSGVAPRAAVDEWAVQALRDTFVDVAFVGTTACPESALWCGEPPVRPQPCAGQRPGPIARVQCRSRRRGQGGGPTKRRGSGHDCGSRPGSGSDGSTGATFGHRHARSARSPTRRRSLRRSVGRAGGELPPHGRPPSTADIHGAGPYDLRWLNRLGPSPELRARRGRVVCFPGPADPRGKQSRPAPQMSTAPKSGAVEEAYVLRQSRP